MESLNIRKASLDDLAAIVDLVNIAYRSKEIQGWTSESDIVVGDRIDHEQLKQLIHMKNSFIFLDLNVDKSIIGTVHLQVEQGVGYIGLLTTHPKIQNRGIGKILLQYAEDYCFKNYGINSFEISVLSTRVELIDFYERRGYRFTGQVDSYPIEKKVGTPLMDIQILYFKKII